MSDKKKQVLLTKPFALIDEAWQAFLKKVPFYVKIVLPPTLFYLFLDTLSYVSQHGNPTSPLVLFAKGLQQNGLLVVLLYTVAFMLQLVSTVALLTALFSKKDISVTDAYEQGKRKFWPYLWLSLLSACISGGGFLLLIIPGVVLSVWFTFAQYILFHEHKQGITALMTSREYVRGYFWPILGRIIFISLIVMALSSIAGYVSFIFQNELVVTVAQSLVTLITIPLAIIYQTKLYENIRSIKGEVALTTKPGWFYLVGSLVPFLAIVLIATGLLSLGTVTISSNEMSPSYHKGEQYVILKQPFALIFGSSETPVSKANSVVYRKDTRIQIKRIIASPGASMKRTKDTLVIQNTGIGVVDGTYQLSLFMPNFPLAPGQSRTLGRDQYYVTADNWQQANPNWDIISSNQMVGVPLFCYWNCK